MSIFGWVAGGIAIIVIAVSFGGFVQHINAQADHDQKMHNICDYLGGEVHGDVCVKDGRVVYTYHK